VIDGWSLSQVGSDSVTSVSKYHFSFPVLPAVGAGLILLLAAYIRYRQGNLAATAHSSYIVSSKVAKQRPESDSAAAPGGLQAVAGGSSLSGGLSDRGFLAWLIGAGSNAPSESSSNNPARRLLGLQFLETSSDSAAAGSSSAHQSRCCYYRYIHRSYLACDSLRNLLAHQCMTVCGGHAGQQSRPHYVSATNYCLHACGNLCIMIFC
jgi:hypothetical protein